MSSTIVQLRVLNKLEEKKKKTLPLKLEQEQPLPFSRCCKLVRGERHDVVWLHVFVGLGSRVSRQVSRFQRVDFPNALQSLRLRVRLEELPSFF